MKFEMKIYSIFLSAMLLFVIANCTRNMGDNGHHIDALIPKSAAGVPGPVSQQKQYTKSRKPEVEAQHGLTSGSLNGVHPVHFFIADKIPHIGDIVTIKIKTPSGQKDDVSGKAEAPNSGGAPVSSDVTDKSKNFGDEKLEALAAEMPDFSEFSPPPIKTEFKARIIGVDEAGDFVISFNRDSASTYEIKSLQILAKISKKAVVFNDELTTDDLYDISWQQSSGGKNVSREALAWEPAFTRELERFTESRSAKDIELEEKRARLENIKKMLSKEINSFAEQKNKFVGEREKLQEMQKLANEDSDAYLKRIQEEKQKETDGAQDGSGDATANSSKDTQKNEKTMNAKNGEKNIAKKG